MLPGDSSLELWGRLNFGWEPSCGRVEKRNIGTSPAAPVGRKLVGSLVLLDEMWRPASALREEDRRGQCSRRGDGYRGLP
jgi:hypothetical protein